jgi:hypothetical protein
MKTKSKFGINIKKLRRITKYPLNQLILTWKEIFTRNARYYNERVHKNSLNI